MESESEIVLETEEAPVVEIGEDLAPEGSRSRSLPFSFSKRHGVLIRDISDGKADAVYRNGSVRHGALKMRRGGTGSYYLQE